MDDSKFNIISTLTLLTCGPFEPLALIPTTDWLKTWVDEWRYKFNIISTLTTKKELPQRKSWLPMTPPDRERLLPKNMDSFEVIEWVQKRPQPISLELQVDSINE